MTLRDAGQQAALYYARKRNRAAQNSTPVADKSALAWGSIAFPSNVAQSITLGGTVVNLSPGVDLSATLAALLVTINASADAEITKCTYAIEGSTLTIKAKMPGVTTFTLSASAGTVSHDTLQLPTIYARAAL